MNFKTTTRKFMLNSHLNAKYVHSYKKNANLKKKKTITFYES